MIIEDVEIIQIQTYIEYKNITKKSMNQKQSWKKKMKFKKVLRQNPLNVKCENIQ